MRKAEMENLRNFLPPPIEPLRRAQKSVKLFHFAIWKQLSPTSLTCYVGNEIELTSRPMISKSFSREVFF